MYAHELTANHFYIFRLETSMVQACCRPGRAVVFQPALSKIFATISKQFHQVYNIGYCGLQHCTCQYYYRNTIFDHSLHGTHPSPVLHITSAKVEQSLLHWDKGHCCRLRAGQGWAGPKLAEGRTGKWARPGRKFSAHAYL